MQPSEADTHSCCLSAAQFCYRKESKIKETDFTGNLLDETCAKDLKKESARVENMNVAKAQSDFLTGRSLNLRLNRRSWSLKRCPVQETSPANRSHTACQLFPSPLHPGQLAAVGSGLARRISGGSDGGVCENCGLPENQCIYTVCPSITRPFILSEGASVKSRIH